MSTILPKKLNAINIEIPLDISFNGDDAVTLITRASANSGNWIALPIKEEIGSPETIYTRRLSEYCLLNKIHNVIGFSPRFPNKNGIMNVEPSAENFSKIESNFALRAYTIVPVPGIFQVLSDGDYYTIFIGTQEFLSFVLGCTLEEGMKNFKSYIKKYKVGSLEQIHLLKVIKACDLFNTA